MVIPQGWSGVLDAGLASFLGCQQGYLSPGVGVRAAEYDLVQQLFADDVHGQAVQEIGGHCLRGEGVQTPCWALSVRGVTL